MHENRETSETPAVQLGRRSAGEGTGHTARMHVSEESHSGIVPMNHSNKDGIASAESEEGRLRLKENTFPFDTYPTQRGTARAHGWASVRTSDELGRYSSERRTGCANERPSGSVRGAPGTPVSLPRSTSVTVFRTFNNITTPTTIKQLDGCKLFLLPYSLGDDLSTAFVDSVCSGVVFRSDHFVEAPVYELYRTVVFDSDADAAGSANHVSEVFPSRNSPCPTVVMGAVNSLDEAKASYTNVIPVSWIGEGHRIRMSRIKPADGTCTDARKHSSFLVGFS